MEISIGSDEALMMQVEWIEERDEGLNAGRDGRRWLAQCRSQWTEF
jgi:hypothetical protein